MNNPNLLKKAVAAHGGLDRRVVIPTTRRGYTWQGDYQPILEPLLVGIDMKEITLH